MGKTTAFSIAVKLGLTGLLCAPLILAAESVNLKMNTSAATASVPDSIGEEIIRDEIYILHRVKRKETYYALSRLYQIPVKRIMDVNKKKNLKPGDTLKIPTGRRQDQVGRTASPSPAQSQQADPPRVLTEYKVGKKETLYAISRRFGTTVEAIKKMNALNSDSLREGTTLKIPNADYREPAADLQAESIMVDADTLSNLELTPEQIIAANRYGIREKQEKGIGVWINNLETDGKSNLALHKTAPIGTILKITNPMTHNVTYAKVVGKFTDTADTKDAIVVLSKSAAAYIGALDRRFLIEIAYGLPVQ